MAYVFDGRQVAQEAVNKDTLKRGVLSSKIDMNKRMASSNHNMDRYRDFFLENEKDSEEENTPTPQEDLEESTQTPKAAAVLQCPNFVQMDEHTEICQNCGAQKIKPRFEHQPGEQKTACGVPLKYAGSFDRESPAPAAADQPVTKGWYAQSWQDLAMAMQGKIDVLEEKVRSYHTTDRSKRALANEDIVESTRDAIEALEMKINSYHG
ncbi:unnamed protein product [Mytilus coruscus]|uniref:Uncharacterized protein n=1 Tax=Mytilus coruscus TaxID=42192 RepID=A0A6J8EW25_MYTCO|nr:unnamed protein product [Mytilus coruscus]